MVGRGHRHHARAGNGDALPGRQIPPVMRLDYGRLGCDHPNAGDLTMGPLFHGEAAELETRRRRGRRDDRDHPRTFVLSVNTRQDPARPGASRELGEELRLST